MTTLQHLVLKLVSEHEHKLLFIYFLIAKLFKRKTVKAIQCASWSRNVMRLQP
jgi:hypothetical protein